MSVPREIFMMGCVFGMCLSANFAAQQYGGCSDVGFSLHPSNPCSVVMAAVNCTTCMALLYMGYQLMSSGGSGGGY